MCGIFGWMSQSDPLPLAALAGAVQALGHRGPDGSGMWMDPMGKAGLGHTRLSMVDLEFGAQPMSNEDGSLHLVVNGELYGYAAIARTLTAQGHRLATHSDSEIVVHLYEDLACGCLKALRGEFAFALWDARRQILFAARDRFGIKPLFWAECDGRLLVASEVKAMLRAGVAAAWDGETYLRTLFLCQPPRDTLFAGIRQVPPGHYLIADGTRTRIVQYWDLDYPTDDEPRRDLDVAGAAHVLRDQLEDAIHLRLQADVPVGMFLSGGIDSSVVAGMAARGHDTALQSFTVRFADCAFDEGEIARDTAGWIGARHTEVAVTAGELAEHWEDAVWHGETLAANAHGVARYLQARAVRRAGCKTVLSGEGADEVLAGYSFSRRDWDAGMAPAGAARSETATGLAAVAARLGFVPAWMRNAACERALLHALLTPELAAEADRLDVYGRLVDDFDVEGQLRGRHPVIQSLYLWSHSVLPGYILFADRMEMAHGIESRLPYLDHRLFEQVRQFPARLLMSGERSKQVLREAGVGYVTPEVVQRPKQPFAAPALATGDSPCKHALRSRIRADIAGQGFFDAPAVIAFLDRLDRIDRREPGADEPFEPVLLLIASTLALQRRYRLTSWRA